MQRQPLGNYTHGGDDQFTTFALTAEPRLRRALVAAYGPERGAEGASEAMAHGWENWSRVSRMDNPIGYLYRVAQSKTRAPRVPRLSRHHTHHRDPEFEPQLDAALRSLPIRQRQAVLLVHGYEYSIAEAAEVVGVQKGTLQTHLERGMKRLRTKLGED